MAGKATPHPMATPREANMYPQAACLDWFPRRQWDWCQGDDVRLLDFGSPAYTLKLPPKDCGNHLVPRFHEFLEEIPVRGHPAFASNFVFVRLFAV